MRKWKEFGRIFYSLLIRIDCSHLVVSGQMVLELKHRAHKILSNSTANAVYGTARRKQKR